MKRMERIEFGGRSMHLTAWAREIGLNQCTLSFRLNSGWSVEKALTTPIGKERGGLIRPIKHHMRSTTPEFRVWSAITYRCWNPNSQQYRNYGGRGITVCDRWAESFENFLADMGPRPGRGYSIERKNNDGPYSPENCKWATSVEQANNRRTSAYLTFGGETMSVTEWGHRFGLNRETMYGRLRRGWTVERTLLTPAQPISQAWRSKRRTA